MGGRVSTPSVTARQLSMNDVERQNIVAEIIKERTSQIGTAGSEMSGGVSSPQLLKKCACCKEYTLPVNTEYELCPICGWIDDPFQNKNPNSAIGRNPMSLVEAQEIHRKNIAR